MTVYFIRPVGANGPVKIGSSATPENRLRAYMAWSPVALEIVARCPGGKKVEWGFHALFAGDRSHHEWFNPSPRLDSVIASLVAGTFDPATLPAPKRLPRKIASRTAEQREAHSLSIRLGHRARRGRVPMEVRDAAYALHRLSGAEREAAKRLIEDCIASVPTVRRRAAA